MLCGNPPLAAAAGAGLLAGPFGRRALFSIPMGVDEAVMEDAASWSDTDRREGTRGIFDPSAIGLAAGDSSRDSGEPGPEAKSTESSGALGTSFGGAAMDDSIQVSICGA